ncbi:hypothetical protein [Bradyrhizobium sp. NP1]|nr:hypothetical protein [Bradyrhizobium sp. NP1]WJR80026.1 hypothetical protein QOU61_09750 [Bradyrhizobium sp. NP1]
MAYVGRLAIVTAVILLLGSAIWANFTKAPMSEMRGAWISQAMRGSVH